LLIIVYVLSPCRCWINVVVLFVVTFYGRRLIFVGIL